MTLISIIVPTFNEEKNIGRLLKSVGRQTIGCEVVVVDDGSSDRTVEIAKKFTKRVYLRKHAERSVQRNFGASRAKGNYLLIVDADMELTPGVLESCLANINGHGALVVPERTVGKGFMVGVRKFEREMYMGDETIEVARFFPKKIFNEFDGYDKDLTGTEDYDLPKRISRKYTIGWAGEYILHHETGLTLGRQLRKKFYYAQKSALYAKKHPDLISKQGILILRKAYFRHWRKFVSNPLMGILLIFTRSLETVAAALGFLKAVGPVEFMKTLFRMFKYL